MPASAPICPSCSQQVAFPVFCDSCESFIETSPQPDFFSLLNLECKFSLDERQIEGRYEELMSLIHPDFFQTAPEPLKSQSLQYSSQAKQARDTLLKPYERALYLFRQFYPETEQKFIATPQLAAEMFELRERLEDTGADDPDLIAEVSERHNTFMQNADSFFQNLGKDDRNKLDEARQIICEFKFWVNIGEVLKHIGANE